MNPRFETLFTTYDSRSANNCFPFHIRGTGSLSVNQQSY